MSIVMSVCVCVSVCLSTSISPQPLLRTLVIFSTVGTSLILVFATCARLHVLSSDRKKRIKRVRHFPERKRAEYGRILYKAPRKKYRGVALAPRYIAQLSAGNKQTDERCGSRAVKMLSAAQQLSTSAAAAAAADAAAPVTSVGCRQSPNTRYDRHCPEFVMIS